MILNRVIEFNVINLKGVQLFSDFVNVYFRFVNNSAELTITWLKLIRKHVRLKWQEYNSLASLFRSKENGLIKEKFFFLLKALNVSSSENEQVHKFFHVYDGPYLIKKKIAEDTYIIVSDDGKEKGQFHVKNLKPYF